MDTPEQIPQDLPTTVETKRIKSSLPAEPRFAWKFGKWSNDENEDGNANP
jgi:hypothetical protein